MTERSARFGLPFILPGQAQKEMFHNEALAVIDGLLHPVVESLAASPPGAAALGESWLVAAPATGAWENHDGELATFTAGGWRFSMPVAGMTVWDQAAGFARRWLGSAWSDGAMPVAGIEIGGDQIIGPRQPDVPSPSGGTTIDAEARAAIDMLIVTLKSHGLID